MYFSGVARDGLTDRLCGPSPDIYLPQEICCLKAPAVMEYRAGIEMASGAAVMPHLHQRGPAL
jgi:hypothetical protein